MRRKTISVSLTPEGVKRAIEELKAEKEFIETKKKEILQELAKIGIETAKSAYNSSTMVIDVKTLKRGYCIKLFAEGHHVAFLEFGAGVATDSESPLAQNFNDFEVKAGSWSSTVGKNQFALNGYWMWGHVLMTEVQPRRGMLQADLKMQQEFANVARKVFG